MKHDNKLPHKDRKSFRSWGKGIAIPRPTLATLQATALNNGNTKGAFGHLMFKHGL